MFTVADSFDVSYLTLAIPFTNDIVDIVLPLILNATLPFEARLPVKSVTLAVSVTVDFFDAIILLEIVIFDGFNTFKLVLNVFESV